MGIFGRKKKKPQNDFDDDEGGDDGPRDEEGPGPMGGGPSGMGGGSDDNPYADDPAHKHLVKLLDTNGLVRHRRAFIRNSVYTVEHAKKLDAGKLEKIGVFLEADRKKLLRIFKDAETVESTVDAERAKEKEAMEEPPKKKEKKEKKDKKKKKDDEDEDDGKKSKKSKKDGSKKEKSKKGKKDRKKGRDEDEGDDEDEGGEKKSKKSKRDKGNKSKKGKSEDEGEESGAEKKSKKSKKEKGKKGKKDAKSDVEDDLDLEMEEEEAKGKKSKKSKRDKGKKSKKDETEDLDDFEGLEVGEGEESKSKKKGKDRSKTKPKGKKSKKDDDFDDLDMEKEGGKGDETETDALADLDKELEEAEATAKKNEKPRKPKPKKEKPDKVEEPEAPPAEMKTQTSSEHVTETPEEPKEGPIERKMSHGDQALKLLNAKLGQQGKRRSQSRRQSAKSLQSTGTIDEDEELWWKSLDKPSNASKKMTSESETETTSESEKFASKGAKAKAKKTLKVKPEFGTKLEYITDEENSVLQNFRQGKTKRKTRQTPPPPAPRQVPTYNPTVFNPYAPPPIPPKASESAPTQVPNLQPPGQATTGQQIQPPVPPNYVMPQQWGYYPPPQMYYTDEEDEVSDGSVGEYSKYKYYKDKYNERKKKKAQKKHEIRQQLVKQKSRPKTKRKPADDASFKPKRQASEKLYVDLKKEDALPTEKDLRRRKRSDGNRVDDREVNASENEAEPQRFGNDDYYFNFAHQKNATVRMGKKGADEMKSERKVNYFQTPKDGSGYESDTELYVMRRKLAEVGASKFYPLLVKHGILSLKNCDLQKLEQLPIASRSQKKALIRTLLELRKGSRNIKKRTFHAFSDSETEALTLASESEGSGLKSALKKKRNTSKQKSTKNRHYFSLASEIESDPEPDHVKAGPIAPEAAKVDDDKKSVKFDLDDEDEISLPSYSEGNGSESDLSLDSDYSD